MVILPSKYTRILTLENFCATHAFLTREYRRSCGDQREFEFSLFGNLLASCNIHNVSAAFPPPPPLVLRHVLEPVRPGGGVARQGVVLTDLQSLLDCQ